MYQYRSVLPLQFFLFKTWFQIISIIIAFFSHCFKEDKVRSGRCWVFSVWAKISLLFIDFYSQKRLLGSSSLTSCIIHTEELMLKTCWKWKVVLPREAKLQQLQELGLDDVLPSLLGGISSLHLLPSAELPFFPCYPVIRSSGVFPRKTRFSISFLSYLL